MLYLEALSSPRIKVMRPYIRMPWAFPHVRVMQLGVLCSTFIGVFSQGNGGSLCGDNLRIYVMCVCDQCPLGPAWLRCDDIYLRLHCKYNKGMCVLMYLFKAFILALSLRVWPMSIRYTTSGSIICIPVHFSSTSGVNPVYGARLTVGRI